VSVEHRPTRHVPHQSNQGFNRLQQAEEALATEQAAHQNTLRALRQAQEALLEAETKRGHGELALHEAHAARAAVEGALAAERAAREALETELRELRAAFDASVLGAGAEPAGDEPPRRRRRQAQVEDEVPAAEDGAEPVQWWVPGWRRSAR
jgi:hypothetical protein